MAAPKKTKMKKNTATISQKRMQLEIYSDIWRFKILKYEALQYNDVNNGVYDWP